MSAYAAFYCPLNGFHCDAQLIAVNLGKAAGEAFFTSSQYSTATWSFTCMASSTCIWIQIFNCRRVFYVHVQKHTCGSKYSTATGSFTCLARSACVDLCIQLLQGLLHAWPEACVWIQVFNCSRVPVFLNMFYKHGQLCMHVGPIHFHSHPRE